MTAATIAVHYRRLPDREQVFEQKLVHDAGEYVVTLLEKAPLERPVTAGGETVLEPGAPVVWLTYPARWYDIGLFHLRDGTFTGYYANVLTPVEMGTTRWETTDLCLDVWVGKDGRVEILDEEEFAEAVRRGWLDEETAALARGTAASISAGARLGAWPPSHVTEWTLDRVRDHLRSR